MSNRLQAPDETSAAGPVPELPVISLGFLEGDGVGALLKLVHGDAVLWGQALQPLQAYSKKKSPLGEEKTSATTVFELLLFG